MTLNWCSPKELSCSICKMGKSGLVPHSLGFFPWLTGGEVGISGEVLKVCEAVNELLFNQLPLKELQLYAPTFIRP